MTIRLASLFIAVSKHFNDGMWRFICTLLMLQNIFAGLPTVHTAAREIIQGIAHLKLECTIKLYTQTLTLIPPYLSVDNPWLYNG